MDPFSLILGVGQLVPGFLRWMNKDNAADVAEKAIAIGRTITGKEAPEDVLAELRAKPEIALQFQQASNALIIAELDAETKQLQAINETMRAEYNSGDPYVRRARPTWLYAMALTWVMQTAGISVAMVFKPELSAQIVNAVAALTGMWSVALAVVGIAVKARSDDKARALGKDVPTMLDALTRPFSKSR